MKKTIEEKGEKMSKEIKDMKFKPKEKIKRELNYKVQYLFEFDNKYGASVVRSRSSYCNEKGLYELAVIEWEAGEYSLTYETEITNDVIGHLTVKGVNELLDEIKKLKENKK